MKRRILSITMALTIVLSLLSGPALAAENGADESTAYLSYVKMPSGNSFPATLTFSNLIKPDWTKGLYTFTAYLLTGTYPSWQSAVAQIGTANQVGKKQTNPSVATGTLDLTVSRDQPAWFFAGDPYTLVIICQQDSATDTLTTGSNETITNVLNVNYWYFTVGDDSSSGHGASGNTGVTNTTEVTLEPTTVILTAGETTTVHATLTPENSTENVVWSSSNPEIASVDQTGTVTGLARGQAIITARSGDCSAQCVVTVNAAGPEDISQTGLNISNKDGYIEPTGETVFQAGNGTITFQPATETAPTTLILENATISSDTPAEDQSGNSNDIKGIVLDSSKNYNIVLVGTNRFEHLYTAIDSDGDKSNENPSVTISGDGTLTLDDCRTGINVMNQLVFEGVDLTVNALEYGVTTYGALKILSGSDLKVCTKGTTIDSRHTNCAMTSYSGNVEISNSTVNLRTDKPDITQDNYSWLYSWGIYTETFYDDACGIVVDNSTLSINGYIYGIRDETGCDISIENGSALTIESGMAVWDSIGICYKGNLSLNDDSHLTITPGGAVKSCGLFANKTGNLSFGGSSSAEITSTKYVANRVMDFDTYIAFTDASGEKGEAAYDAKVNTAATSEGAVDWRHDVENPTDLKGYQYLKITPRSPVVTYVTNCDTVIDPQSVPYQTPIEAPAVELIRPGYTLGGWYSDAECTQSYNFNTPVRDNMTLYAKWLENLPNPPAGEDNTEYQVVMEKGLSEVPEELQKMESLNSPEKIEIELKTVVKQADGSITDENTAIYDVTLMVSTDGGATWNEATKDNFPKDGKLTVTLPYPDGTNRSYTFTVVHMFTTNDFGKIPGTTEMPTVTNTDNGIQFTVTGLSPILVGWTVPKPSSSGGVSGVSSYAVTVEKSEHGKVTASHVNAVSGATVTLTVTPDSGYVLDALTVTDNRGIELNLTAKGDGKYTFTMPGGAITVKASFAPLPDGAGQPYDGAGQFCDGGADCPSHGFADLNTDAWYHEAVDYVLRNSLMGGYDSSLFGPNDNLSRAQLAQILYNHAGRPAITGTNHFTDVANGAWYTDAITWAAEKGVVSGYGNGMFGPDDSITREQLATILWRYAGSPASTGNLDSFTDANDVDTWAVDALRWAEENKIISGKGDGILDPVGKATRAEVAAMLMRYCETLD